MPLGGCADRGADTLPAPLVSTIPSSTSTADAPQQSNDTLAPSSRQVANAAAFKEALFSTWDSKAPRGLPRLSLKKKYMKPGNTPGAGVVSEVVYTTSFEAQTQLVIGLNKKTPYSVTFLEHPKRLVLDFQE
ncbi:AMIN domain-containing protein [Corynebacterium sp. HMSC068H04]|nr:AMIN domain-containing protein [Corynebacterium sp. HMSC068H04]